MSLSAAVPPTRRELHFGRLVRTFNHRPASVDAMLRQVVERWPEATALKDEGVALTYRDLDGRVDAAVHWLLQLGVVRGTRVAFVIPNSVDLIILVLAVSRAGAIGVPMNIRQRKPETFQMVENSGAALLIYGRSVTDNLPAAAEMPGVQLVDVDTVPATLPAGVQMCETIPPSDDDTFCILYTSGTTGRPKGAVLTHMGVVLSCRHYRDAFDLTGDDSIVLAVPLCHVTGLVAVLLTMLSAGGKVVVMGEFKARRYIELAEQEQTTYAFMVPTMYTLCLMQGSVLGRQLPHWRVGAYGGAPMPEATIHALRNAAPALAMFNVYGATEVTSPATILSARDAMDYSASCGKALACIDLLVVDENGTELVAGETGEVWIGGGAVSPGYWNDPAATAASFTSGYWRSGDMGSLDANGHLRILGRRKEMINRAGYKVYPSEVENILNLHPQIVEAAVFGYPDPVMGERIRAYVVVRGDDIPESDIRAHCANHLSDYKVPDLFTLSEKLVPRMANGKIDKSELRLSLS